MPERYVSTAFTVLRNAWRDGKRVWRPLLITDLAYKLLAFAVLAPLVGLAIRIGISLSGQSALADTDILFFLLSPVGVAVLIVAAALFLALAALAQACLMTIAMAEIENTRVSVVEAVLAVLGRAGSVMRLAVRLVVRCLFWAAPFLAGLGLVFLLLLRNYDINYYLTEKPPVFLAAVAVAALLVLSLAWILVPRLIGWSLALPLVLFEKVPSTQAFAESGRRVTGQRKLIARVLVLWGVGSFLMSFLLPGLVFGIGRMVAPRAIGNLGALLPVMLLITVLWLLANGVASWLAASAFAVLIVELYQRYGGKRGRSALEALAHDAEAPADKARAAGLTPARAVLGLLMLVVAAAGLGWFLLGTVKGNDDVTVIAHRGAASVAPENTMASVQAALDQGTDYVEIDVQENADGEVMVLHDSDLMKVGGTDLKLWDATDEQLAAIDIGSWYASEFADQRVPSLQQVLEAARGRAKVTIELKYYGHDQALEQKVIDLVENLGMAEQVAVMSLKYDGVEKMRGLRPEWNLGLLTATVVGDLTQRDADFLAVNARMASRSFINRAHRRGKEVWVWTVNDPVQMFRLMNRGVDGVITDQPGLAKSVVERRAELTSLQRLLVSLAFHFGAAAPDPPAEVDL